MKPLFLPLPLLTTHPTLAPIHALYLFENVLVSNTTGITSSGTTNALLFGVGVLPNASIMYYSNISGSKGKLIADNGIYSGGDALASKVKSLKSAPGSSIQRIEVTMNSQNVAELMSSPGPGTDTPLARNFAALKDAWSLDGVNNNDEIVYDASSTTSFARMLGSIGYKYTLVPYENQGFWAGIIRTLGTTLVDVVYLQCYDGGAYNDPNEWKIGLGDAGVNIVPLVWVTNDAKPGQGNTAAQARMRFSQWRNAKGSALAGGGYWNDYDIEKMGLSYEEYGSVLTEVFG